MDDFIGFRRSKTIETKASLIIKVEVRGRGIKLFTPYQSHYIHIVVASWCKGSIVLAFEEKEWRSHCWDELGWTNYWK